MKVLKSGNARWEMELTCTGRKYGNSGCGAVLLVEVADLFRVDISCPCDGWKSFRAAFACPECGVTTDLPADIRLPVSADDLPERGYR